MCVTSAMHSREHSAYLSVGKYAIFLRFGSFRTFLCLTQYKIFHADQKQMLIRLSFEKNKNIKWQEGCNLKHTVQLHQIG